MNLFVFLFVFSVYFALSTLNYCHLMSDILLYNIINILTIIVHYYYCHYLYYLCYYYNYNYNHSQLLFNTLKLFS